MRIWMLIGIAALVMFVLWRLNIRASGTWIDLPSDPHANVKPIYAQLVDWLANEAETQIGRGHNIVGDPIALGILSETVELALAHRGDDGQIEISIPELIGDAEGMYGFQVTVNREQLEEFRP